LLPRSSSLLLPFRASGLLPSNTSRLLSCYRDRLLPRFPRSLLPRCTIRLVQVLPRRLPAFSLAPVRRVLTASALACTHITGPGISAGGFVIRVVEGSP
jgi:hypothetical protein